MSSNFQPTNYTTKLFPHQLSAIKMMEEKEQNKVVKMRDCDIDCSIGIYADLMGFGKTCSIIGLLARDNFNWDVTTDFKINTIRTITPGILSTTTSEVYKKLNTSIILANNSIINQWKDEIDKTTLDWIVIDKVKKINDDIIKENLHNNKLNVILIIPSMFNEFIRKYHHFAWKRFIFDEPTHTHIPSMFNIKAGFFWLITATPDMLLYNVRWGNRHFLSNLFNWRLSYDIFKKMIVKNDDEFVKSSYILPDIETIYHECYQPTLNLVRRFIPEEVSMMIEAGNISAAIEYLGGQETSNIVDVIKENKQEQIREIEVKITYWERRRNTVRVTSLTEKREKLLKEISELSEKFNEMIEGNCCVCLETITEPVLMTCCQNIFCGKCILEWMKSNTTCPLCRSPTNDKKTLIYINKNTPKTSTPSSLQIKPTKCETIVKLVNENKEGRFVIFSEYDETAVSIRSILKYNHITFKQLKGMSSARAKYIQSFKDGKIQVLFLNSSRNGAGINLQETTDIIMYHNMEESQRKQIIGRANRIGRNGTLRVHYLI